MSVGSRRKPSSTVDALLTGAIARVKTEADAAIAKVKAEADEVITRFKVETKEKARTLTDTTDKVKPSSKVEALLLEAVAKQKAKSEAEIAKAIARVKAEAEAKAYTDTKARIKPQIKKGSAKQKTKSEAETTKATARVKAKEKAKTYTEREAKVKPSTKVEALLLEAVAKQKAKSEAEIAKAIARVKAEAEAKAKTYTDTTAAVMAEAKEASAKQKTKSEADTTKAIAKVKPSSKVEALLLEAVAKQKAQSEAEIAEAIARVKAEAEAKAKTYTEREAEVKTEAEEAIAEQKTKSEAKAEEEPIAHTARLSSPKSDVIAKVRAEAEEAIAEQKTKSEAKAAEAIDRVKAEAIKAIARVQAKAEEEATVYTVTIAKVRDGKKAAATVESQEQRISETFQRMPQSLTVLPEEHFRPDSGTPLYDLLQKGNIGISAKDIMQKELIWGSADDSVQQTVTKMQQYNASYVMVGRDGVLEGIVSKSDITGATSPYLQPVFARRRQFLDDATLQIRIRWIMSRPVHIISPQTSLAGLMKHMCQFRRLCLPVVNQQSKVLGLVTQANILQALLQLQSSPGVSVSGEVAQVKPASGHPPHDSTTQASRTMENSPVYSQ
ncbi:MAG TPA: CBS domain-containing protein [Planctomycetes bacterium]|nr:CBS domain-containing protein [Planctomycetota bacterium]